MFINIPWKKSVKGLVKLRNETNKVFIFLTSPCVCFKVKNAVYIYI